MQECTTDHSRPPVSLSVAILSPVAYVGMALTAVMVVMLLLPSSAPAQSEARVSAVPLSSVSKAVTPAVLTAVLVEQSAEVEAAPTQPQPQPQLSPGPSSELRATSSEAAPPPAVNPTTGISQGTAVSSGKSDAAHGRIAESATSPDPKPAKERPAAAINTAEAAMTEPGNPDRHKM